MMCDDLAWVTKNECVKESCPSVESVNLTNIARKLGNYARKNVSYCYSVIGSGIWAAYALIGW